MTMELRLSRLLRSTVFCGIISALMISNNGYLVILRLGKNGVTNFEKSVKILSDKISIHRTLLDSIDIEKKCSG